MQKPTKAEQARTIDAFAPIDESPTPVLDRSTLEAWANCPYQAHLLESGTVKVVGEIAETGELVHQAFSAATRDWIDSNMALSPRELALTIENAARASRPDLQPDVIRAVRWMAYEWADFLNRVHPHNIRCFDGGEDVGRSGQLAMDIQRVTFTSELDFLKTAEREAYEVDFKSGWKEYTDDTVADSFQFQSHAALVFANFEEIDTLYVQIWNTRRNSKTPWVAFHRKYKAQYEASLIQAILVRDRGEIEPWPTLEKCAYCPCVRVCPAADTFCGPDPIALGQRLVVLEAAYDATKKALEGYVDRFGELELPSGDVIGRQKPADRKKPLAIYQHKEK